MRLLLFLSLTTIGLARYVDIGREKREVEAHDWLTAAQKEELEALKASKSSDELKKRTMELYELLPVEKKKEWNEKYKEMCVAWIKEIATEEEKANYKKWKEENKVDEIKEQYKKLKGRLPEDKRKDVELWENECWNLWKDEFTPRKSRRSITDLAEKHLTFLTEAQKAELQKMKNDGEDYEKIRDKVMDWTMEYWKTKGVASSNKEFLNQCYGWIKDVTSVEEYAAFEKLHHTDHEACRAKVREFLKRLPVEKQETVNKSLPICDALWYKQHKEEHGGHDHHAHKHHMKRHINSMHIEQYLSWLTPEQKAEIHKIEEAESYDAVLTKVKEFFHALPDDKRKELKNKFKVSCASWVKEVASPSELEEIKQLAESGDLENLKPKLKIQYEKLDEEKKHEVDHIKEICYTAWTKKDRKRRSYEEYKDYFSWLTPEQGAEVKALREKGDHEAAHKKTEEYYNALDAEKKAEATTKIKGACKHFFKNAFGDAAVEELKTMKESGSSMDEIAAKVDGLIGKIDDAEKKASANRVAINCKKVFSASRRRRDQKEEEYKKYFDWLTPEQSAELKTLRDSGDHVGMGKKIDEFLSGLSGEKKTEALGKVKGGCRHYFTNLLGESAAEEFKKLKESGASLDDLGAKLDEYLSKIDDEKKKTVATGVAANCKKIFISSASRRRRDHHEEYKDYFSWLTPEQGAEVKALREKGDHDAAYKKTEEYYNALDAEKKTEATTKIKGACKHFFKNAFGEAAVEELKTMKESGSSMDEIAAKVDGLIGKIDDAEKKAAANRVATNCKKVFSASRRRRDHHEEYKQYFDWLSPDQAAEVKALREKGDLDGADKKIKEHFEALAGDKKTEATTKLKGACKHFFKASFGEAAVEEIKTMKESGSSMDEIAAKVDGLIGKIDDAAKKDMAKRVAANCKKVFSSSRRRREHKDDEYKQYFDWLTPEQGVEIKALKESGDHVGIGKKIDEYLSGLSGEKKAEALGKIKGSCRHYFKSLLGESAAEEFKKMKESGASIDEMSTKLDDYIGKIADEKTKATAKVAGVNCKKVFSASRRRRDHHDEYKDYFSWLTPEQGAEVKALREKGDHDAAHKKTEEFFNDLDAEKKTEATTKLKGACRHFFKKSFGDAAVEELKTMKESGSSMDEIAAKVDGLIGKIDDAEKKASANRVAISCKKVFAGASRRRREHHEHTLEEALKDFLPWLSDEQKMELKNMKEAGAEDKIHDKVLEYFETATGDVKDDARVKLQGGCRHYLKHLLGESMASEMKKMHESGSTSAQIAEKLDEIVAKMEDGDKKTKATKLSATCKKVYGVSRRRRSEHVYGEYDQRYQQYYSWMSEEQREFLSDLKDTDDDAAILEKVSQYFSELEENKKEEAKEQLRMRCRLRMRDVLGMEKSDEIRKMKENGATKKEMYDKVGEFVNEMEEGKEKEIAHRAYTHCAKLLTRTRRNADNSIRRFLNWLTDEQKKELDGLLGEPDKIYEKLFDFFDELSGHAKESAKIQMKGACRHFIHRIVGDEQSRKLKVLKEAGEPWPVIQATIDAMVEGIIDDKQRKIAQSAITQCKKVLL